MKKGEYLRVLYQSPQTVFSVSEIMLLWQEENKSRLRVRLHYYVKQGKLFRLHRGVYSTRKQYDRFELATKMYSPSYVSFESVLFRAGVIFQWQEEVTVASYLSRTVVIDDVSYAFRKMKMSVLLNPFGIQYVNGTAVASVERAFLDTLYHYRDFAFDTIHLLDREKVFEYLPYYQNRRMEKVVFRLLERSES